MNRYRMHINGEQVEARRGAWFPVYDPSTEEIMAEASDADERDIDRAPCRPRAQPSMGAAGRSPRPRSGLGAMQAIELVRSRETREPAAEKTKQIARYWYEHGLIVLSTGSYSSVIRLLMPLVITDDQFDEGLAVLESAFEAVATTSREREGVIA